MISAPAMQTTVRRLTHDDVSTVVAMALRFLSTEYAQHIVADPGKVARVTERFIDHEDALGLVTAHADGTLTGMIGIVLVIHELSLEVIAAEQVWWVAPEARGREGLWLLRAAEAWAKSKGAVRLQLIAPNDRVASFYERVGFDKLETFYQRRIE